MDNIVTEMQQQQQQQRQVQPQQHQRPSIRSTQVRQQSLQDEDEVDNKNADIEQKILLSRRASEPPDARKAVMGEFSRLDVFGYCKNVESEWLK